MTNIAHSETDMTPRWEPARFGAPSNHLPLRPLPQSLLLRLRHSGRTAHFAAGSRIFGPGQAPTSLLLLLKGVIRVQRVSNRGREIVLYRLFARDSDALTTEFLMDYGDDQTEGVAETRICALAVSQSLFDELIASSREFREFVFSAFNHRLLNLSRVIEDIAFSRVDERLAHKLIELEADNGRVAATHQKLANELGCSREVISRHINDFQRCGWIKTSRGTVDIVNRAALSRLAQQA
ncbi:Crp/Fnr family transcriptional regulator [Bradyrhizobium ottawaense]|uniref:Crp/Fnr family transcriptional regulator n=1 Tax=Bradyrhizobium ottawaense TaxID=931866 RepID=UPI001FD9419D|nr:Crp/Fnr family transcriptional regulator [Bradyrhizobium ottawaense]